MFLPRIRLSVNNVAMWLSKEHTAICVFVVLVGNRPGEAGNIGEIYVKDFSLPGSTEV
ncbi:hypothetical protein [Sphingobacterium corticibacterium]|uniref:hypothetical protein n=1 Tax=Sphingobacterium corticibacterium TaxID=2484746 RepID=UPI0019D14A6C|nr:hypothetical protein [Sphingobacterium corticibacterium]